MLRGPGRAEPTPEDREERGDALPGKRKRARRTLDEIRRRDPEDGEAEVRARVAEHRAVELALGGVAVAHRLPEWALRVIFAVVALVSAVGLFLRR